MAHIWYEEANGWSTIQLANSIVAFTGNPATPFEPVPEFAEAAAADAYIDPCHNGNSHMVVAPASSARTQLRVNGLFLPTGAHFLRDRDEVLVGRVMRWFYSTDRPPHIEPYPGSERQTAYCPRCKLTLAPGTPSVQCPGSCALWFHESDERRCWTYAETCVCGHPTAFDQGFRWTPAEL